MRYVTISERRFRLIEWYLGALTVGLYGIFGACVFFLWRTKSLLGLW
jgi:hypothetical protein